MREDGEVDDMSERKQRDKLAGLIMRSLAKTSALPGLEVTADDGTMPIVVAFDHELVSDVLHRVSWTGGFANLFVVDLAGQSMVRASVMPPDDALDSRSAEVLRPDAVHGDSTIGMLLESVRASDSGLTIHVRLGASRADVRQVGEPEKLPV